MNNIINKNNKKIINPPKDNIARTCSCIRKHQCPLNKKCLTNNVFSKASITPNKENSKIYYGVSYSSSNMQTIKKNSITSNTKLIQIYQTNIGILYYHISKKNFKHILGNFGNPQIIQPIF